MIKRLKDYDMEDNGYGMSDLRTSKRAPGSYEVLTPGGDEFWVETIEVVTLGEKTQIDGCRWKVSLDMCWWGYFDTKKEAKQAILRAINKW